MEDEKVCNCITTAECAYSCQCNEEDKEETQTEDSVCVDKNH